MRKDQDSEAAIPPVASGEWGVVEWAVDASEEVKMTASESTAGRDGEFDRLVRQEELILDVTETLTQALETVGVTRAELARRLGRSPGFVSQVFGGGRNLTLRTIADIASALSVRPALTLSAVCETRREPARASGVGRSDREGTRR